MTEHQQPGAGLVAPTTGSPEAGGHGDQATTRPGTAVDDVFITLQERIISGYYAPGMRMSQEAIANELNVSRTPLREALARLETEGLVVGSANRGMAVAPARLADAEDAYAIRLLLEPPMIGVTAVEFSTAELRSMTEALAAMERPDIGTAEYQAAHLAFHEVALSRYPSAICDLTRRLHRRIYRHQRIYFSRPLAVSDFNSVDREFLNALRLDDRDTARQLLEFHLLDAAIGSILDVDDSYSFDALDVAARSIGIEIEGLSDRVLRRPAQLTWARPGAVRVPHITTHNLTTF